MLLIKLFVVLSIVIATIPQQQGIDRHIRLVFVQPRDETFTQEEQEQSITKLKDAASFWQDLSPIPTRLDIASTELLTTTEDVYYTHEWYSPYLSSNDHTVTVFIIDNSESNQRIAGRATGRAYPDYGIVWAVLTTNLPNGLPATLAHELGHVLYDLKDLYTGSCNLDIMCNMVTAYRMRFISCESLEALGAPCKRIYMSIIGT
jgi:hypothetical protein